MSPSDNDSASLLPFGRCASSPTALSPTLNRFGMNLYRQARSAYEEAGAPWGLSDAALVIWYTFQQDIEAFGPTSSGRPVLPVYWN
jgi:hypothetical protein